MDWRVVTTSTDFGLASILRGCLEAAGIETQLSGEDMESVFPGTTLAPVRILVRPEDYSRALDVIAQAEDQGACDEDDEE